MRVKTFYRVLRFLSAVVLFFFIWTFGPAWQAVALAATGLKTDVKAQTIGKPETGKQKAAERFEDVLAEVREKVARSSEKHAKGEDDSTEREALRAGRASIDQISEELRAEFLSTEKRLKTAGLPKEILTRHASFVAHFERNVKELHDNLDGIEAAKTKAGRGAKIEKARLHLEKTRSQRHYTPLNPDQLPNRNRKATKTVEPRLKQEDFERDFPQQKLRNKQKIADSLLLPDHLAGVPKQKPILLAFNEFASDIPFSLGVQSATPQLVFADSSPVLLAQATGLPSAADLVETPEVQFTDAINAKAQELGCSPVRIYEEIRNSIEFVPTYGSIQGANMCLQTKQCNASDTSSLLISLLRSCNIPAHYVYSTVEIPIDKAMNWVGGFTDPRAAVNFIASGGIPIKAYAIGGVINKIQMEHVSVETYVPYGPYSGRSSNLNVDKIWVPLDPSFKQYTYTEGIDLQTAVPFDTQAFANQIQFTTTINETEGSVANVNTALIQQAMQDYQLQMHSYIQQNKPTATVGDIIGKKEIKKQELGILPVTLPYKTVITGVKYSEIPDNLRHKISINLLDENGTNTMISVTKALPEVAGKKLTLSYSPATSADETTLINYVNSPSSNLPVYLVNLKPELRIDGQLIAIGTSIGMGKIVPFTMSLISPATGTTFISNNNIVGTYTAIVLDLGITTASQLDKIKTRVVATKAKLDANEITGITKDDVIGEFLHFIGSSYWGVLDVTNKMSAQMNLVADLRMPSEGTFTYDLKASYLFGMPISAVPSGFMTDIDADQHVVVAKDGLVSKELSYMAQIGMMGSRMEASVYDLTFNKTYTGKGITTAHIFEYANQQGIPLYTIDGSNMNSVLPLLTVPDDVKTDIQNAVNAGKMVTVPKTTITKDGWTGAGYLIFDKTNGSGAYKISGGLSGGGYTCNCFSFSPTQEFLLGIVLIIAGAVGSAALAIPLAVATLILSAISLFSSICQVNNISNLDSIDKDYIIYALATIFVIGAVLTALSVFTAGASLVLFGIYWMVMSLLVSNLLINLGNILANSQQQYSYNIKRRVVHYVV